MFHMGYFQVWRDRLPDIIETHDVSNIGETISDRSKIIQHTDRKKTILSG